MKVLLSSILLILFAIQDDFTFVNENQKVVLKIDNGVRTLTWGKKSILNLKIENIDLQKMTMSAPGIRFIKSKNPTEEVKLEVTPDREVTEKDTLNLHVGFRNKNNEYIHHRFSIVITK
ncbi:MAG: hypothetical protein CFE24_13885 [Flavobacterium sp. BFFFF2]|nr:MAG: hypothetical protein CFE24_13885 [Flavobacterium sp. BFFFF2]